jgi:hypothetical protein
MEKKIALVNMTATEFRKYIVRALNPVCNVQRGARTVIVRDRSRLVRSA